MRIFSALGNLLDSIDLRINTKANELKAKKGLPLEILKEGEKIITKTKKTPEEGEHRIKEVRSIGKTEWQLQVFQNAAWKTFEETTEYLFMRSWFSPSKFGNVLGSIYK